MRLSIRTSLDGRFCNSYANVEVPELLTAVMAPIATTDDVTVAYAVASAIGELPADCAEVTMLLKLREDAAAIIAKELTTMLVAQMSKLDTHNGYIKKQSRELEL